MFFIKMCRALGFVCIPQAQYDCMIDLHQHTLEVLKKTVVERDSLEKQLSIADTYTNEKIFLLYLKIEDIEAERKNLIKQNTINELVADSMVKLVDQQFDIIFSLEKRLEVLQAVATHQSYGNRG